MSGEGVEPNARTLTTVAKIYGGAGCGRDALPFEDQMCGMKVPDDSIVCNRKTVAEVASLMRCCDESLAKANAGMRSRFVERSAGSVQLVIICAAITDIIGR